MARGGSRATLVNAGDPFSQRQMNEWEIESTERGDRERGARECPVGNLLSRGSTHWSPEARIEKEGDVQLWSSGEARRYFFQR